MKKPADRPTWRRSWLGLAGVFLLMLTVYLAGYGWMRARHHFVRDGTFYGGSVVIQYPDGRTEASPDNTVHTDSIHLGEWRWGAGWRFLDAFYAPAQYAEACLWRRMHNAMEAISERLRPVDKKEGQ